MDVLSRRPLLKNRFIWLTKMKFCASSIPLPLLAGPVGASTREEMPDQLNVAFVGCGNISRYHLAAAVKSGRVNVAALASHCTMCGARTCSAFQLTIVSVTPHLQVDPSPANRAALLKELQDKVPGATPAQFSTLSDALVSMICQCTKPPIDCPLSILV
jgi:hypothetical protein